MSEVRLPGGRTTGAVRIGDVVHKPAAWVYTDATLVQVGRWLREVHDLTASFEPPAGARFFTGTTMRPGWIVIAFSAILWVPLASASPIDADGRRRFHLLLDSYGNEGDRHAFATVIPERARRQAGVIRDMAGKGDPASVALRPIADTLSKAAADVEALPEDFWTP